MRFISKVLILLCFFQISEISFAQQKITYSSSYDSSKKKLDGSYVVINEDTLYGNHNILSKKQISNFCNNLNDDGTIQMYRDIVYNNLDCGKYKRVLAKQWITKITIYLDKTLPKKVRKEFKSFFESIEGIENLKIDFTNKKKKANYFITSTSEKISPPENGKSHPYDHITYNLLGDNNSKFYGGTLKVNTEAIKNEAIVLSKLKQLFFLSLGQLTLDKDLDDDSLLSYNYSNPNTLSPEDYKLLSLHYLKLYDTPLNCYFYSKFIKQIQSKCTNEQ